MNNLNGRLAEAKQSLRSAQRNLEDVREEILYDLPDCIRGMSVEQLELVKEILPTLIKRNHGW